MSVKIKRILTGDRPTGKLHLGHYVGSLKKRIELQKECDQFVMIADVQALTDNADCPERIAGNVFEVLADYLAVGIDPSETTIFVQSAIPQIAELTIFYLNLITVNRLQHNPTVKNELRKKDFEGGVPAGFLCYPVSQAADITIFKADLVPVGEDQIPVIEEARWLVRKFNEIYKTDVLIVPEALVPKNARLVGLDGKEKMSKSLGNAICLSDSREELIKKIKKMHTGQTRSGLAEPGIVEINPVFIYLEEWMRDRKALAALKSDYEKGGLGDFAVKEVLIEELDHFLFPIRQKRKEVESDLFLLKKILKEGTERALDVAGQTMSEIKSAMKITYFS